MCGIVGYISKTERPDSIKLGIEALKKVNYRGYDSAGLAYWDGKAIHSVKACGQIENLENKLNGNGHLANPVILHTRWATHGKVTEDNCHPHHDCCKNIWVVHNGVIENYQALKKQLESEGHIFRSETDTEVLAHLIEKYFVGNLEDAARRALTEVIGTYGLAVISTLDPGKIVAARLSAPLLFGIGENEYIIASDAISVIARTKKVIYLDDWEIVTIKKDGYTIIREKKPEVLSMTAEDYGKNGYAHYMLKEIMEQPESLANTLKGRIADDGDIRLGGPELCDKHLRQVTNAFITGCGTSFYSSLYGSYLLEDSDIQAKAEPASEFRYHKKHWGKNTALVAVSQSGETADTLACIAEAKANGVLTLGITNVVGSTQSREVAGGIYIHAGPEIGVGSTKAFTSQLMTLALLNLYIRRQRSMSLIDTIKIADELKRIPDLVSQTLKLSEQVHDLADKYSDYAHVFFIGRKYNYPVALEGALKLKEIAYLPAEGLSAGELKHGPLALINESYPTVALCPQDDTFDKMLSNIQEIKARGGPVIALTTEGNSRLAELADDVVYLPKTLDMLYPIIAAVPLQLFAYHMGVVRGCEVDFPKNLAKSVTVE